MPKPLDGIAKPPGAGLSMLNFNLGVMYEEGQGVARDTAEAARWYRQAAERGLPMAQMALADLYANHRGPAQDLVEALRWYPKAAERAYAPALHELAQAYATGRGVPADDVEAYLWMDLAAFRARGALREQCLAERDGFARTMSPEQVAQAERRELEWKKKWAP